jgi:hypothetical protein
VVKVDKDSTSQVQAQRRYSVSHHSTLFHSMEQHSFDRIPIQLKEVYVTHSRSVLVGTLFEHSNKR